MRNILAILLTVTLISILCIGCATDNIDTDHIKEQQRTDRTQGADKAANPEGQGMMQTEVEEMENQDAAFPTVVIQTNKGDIEVELYPDVAPKTVENFLQYVQEGFYDGTVFHRVIGTFMIQGGGFTPDGARKETHDPIELESQNGVKNDRGTIAMARTMVPDSATSQFFINVVDNDMLNYRPGNDGYAVFGKVVSGMEVVDAIKAVQTTTKNGMQDWPVEDVMIESIRVE